jgi:phage shock protein A
MGIFSRLAQLLRSNLNDLISRSEDPEKMLNQIVIEMNQQLIEAKKQVAVSIADEKRLAKQLEQESIEAQGWEKRAMLAIRAGDDALAKEALMRQKEHEANAQQYEGQWQKQKAAVDQLKTALRLLSNKIEEAKRKKGVLVARKRRAEAHKAIQETMNGLRDSSAFEAFDRMSAKIDRIEAEAEAGAELAEEYSGDLLAQKFAKMEVTSGADADLLALKRRMGLIPPLPAVAPPPEKVRVAPQPVTEESAERDELAAALADVEAEEQREQQRMKR